MKLHESNSNTGTSGNHITKTKKSINDIAGTGGMTRSGRCYALVTLGAKEKETSTENEDMKIAAS